MDKCPVCNSISEVYPTDHSNIAHISCKICGEYSITRTAAMTKTFKKYDQYLISAALKYHNENGVKLGRAFIDLKILEECKPE